MTHFFYRDTIYFFYPTLKETARSSLLKAMSGKSAVFLIYYASHMKCGYVMSRKVRCLGVKSVVAYVDIILLLNWCFDSLLLYWTSIFLKKKVPYWRIIISGFLGSAFILLQFTSFYYVTNSVLIKVIVSMFMILLTFGYHRLKIFMKACLLFYFITFSTGGILMGIHFLFAYKFVAANTGFFYVTKSYGDPVSWLFVMIGFPTAWLFARKVFSDLEVTSMIQEGIVSLTIKIKEQIYTCTGLIDTGNQLYEPITNTPVMILSIQNIQQNIPADIVALLEQPLNPHLLSKCTESSWGERVRIIPYKVVGKEQQLLLAFRPDWINITSDQKSGMVQRGLVALTNQTLSHDGTYECIVHPRMVASLNRINVS